MDFKKLINNVNEYLNLIIILPALLGGIWQVIELSRISFSFIRFFSITQIIPDGLLILLFIIIFILSSLVLFWLAEISKREKDEEAEEADDEKENLYHAFFFVLIFIICGLLAALFNKFIIDNIENFYCLIIFLPINILIFAFAYSILQLAINDFKGFISERYLKMISDNLLFGFKLMYGSILVLFMFKFHSVFFLPAELKNIENLVCKVEKVEPNANMDILYANDKYIFVECHKFSKDRNGKPMTSEIRIFKFEDLLDDSACIGNKRIRNQFLKDSIADSKKPKFLK